MVLILLSKERKCILIGTMEFHFRHCRKVKLNNAEFLKNVVDNDNLQAVEAMLADWELYENGWHVVYPKGGYKHPQLFYYLRQFGTPTRPEALAYFNW